MDVENTAMTDQRKPDAEPKERFRLSKEVQNNDKHSPEKGISKI